MVFYDCIVLIEYVGAAEPASQSAREAVKQEEGEAAATIKTEDVIEHEVGQQQEQQQHQQQLVYVAKEEVGEESGVGVLEAGQPEMENGALVEPTGAEVVAIAVAAAAATTAATATDVNEDPNATYTLHELGYHSAHIIHER